MNKKAILTSLLFILVLFGATNVFAEDIEIRLNNIINGYTVDVDFDETQPMTVENQTVVPLRRFCEAAGFSVKWDSQSKRAYVELKANRLSSLPIEQYAYKLLSTGDTNGLELTPASIQVYFNLTDNNINLKYNFKDASGNYVSYGKVTSNSFSAKMTNSGSIVVPIRALMESFGLWVYWNNDSITISMPLSISSSEGMQIVPYIEEPIIEQPADELLAEVPEKAQFFVASNGEPIPENAVYLGRFKITHYCSCHICNGSYGCATAWAGNIRPGVTIAVDPRVIPKLSSVYIDGYGVRIAEDCGGAIKGNRIDMAVSSHAECNRLGVVYKDVWLLK